MPLMSPATSENFPLLASILEQPIDLGLGVRSDTKSDMVSWLREISSQRDRFRIYQISIDGEIVGVLTIQNIDHWNRNAEVGAALRSDLLGKGIMKLLKDQLFHVLWDELGLHRIYGYTSSINERALRAGVYLGATVEGTHPRAGKALTVLGMVKQ